MQLLRVGLPLATRCKQFLPSVDTMNKVYKKANPVWIIDQHANFKRDVKVVHIDKIDHEAILFDVCHECNFKMHLTPYPTKGKNYYLL